MKKRVLSFILVACISAALIPLTLTAAHATAESAGVRAKINEVLTDLNTKLPTKNVFTSDGVQYSGSPRRNETNLRYILPVLGESANDWTPSKTGSVDAYNCAAFAKYIFIKTFDKSKDAVTLNPGRGTVSSTYYSLKTGDIFFTDYPHWMIFLSSDSNGVTVLECNAGGAQLIREHTYLFSSNPGVLSGNIEVWRSPRWEDVDQGTGATASELPVAPTGLSAARVSTSTARLSWNAVSGATSYQVQYSSPTSGGWVTEPDYSTGTTYISTRLGNNTYQFRVRATNAAGSSPWAMISYSHRT